MGSKHVDRFAIWVFLFVITMIPWSNVSFRTCVGVNHVSHTRKSLQLLYRKQPIFSYSLLSLILMRLLHKITTVLFGPCFLHELRHLLFQYLRWTHTHGLWMYPTINKLNTRDLRWFVDVTEGRLMRWWPLPIDIITNRFLISEYYSVFGKPFFPLASHRSNSSIPHFYRCCGQIWN